MSGFKGIGVGVLAVLNKSALAYIVAGFVSIFSSSMRGRDITRGST